MNAVPVLSFVDFSGGACHELPLLLLGPSLGTSAQNLWGACAQTLTDRFRVIGWDLPGHGRSAPDSDFDLESLAKSVLALADDLLTDRGATFQYAGDSVGGAIGLQVLLDAPDRITSATSLFQREPRRSPGATPRAITHNEIPPARPTFAADHPNLDAATQPARAPTPLTAKGSPPRIPVKRHRTTAT